MPTKYQNRNEMSIVNYLCPTLFLRQMDVGEVLARARQQRRVGARSLFCFWAVRELGNSLAALAI